MGNSEKTRIEDHLEAIDFPFKVGLGGLHYQISIVPEFEHPTGPRHGDPQGSPGQYKVIVTLGRPGFSVLPERRFVSHEHNRGDSHLAIAPPALQVPSVPGGANHIQILARTPDGDFVVHGYPNERGFLGTVVAESVIAQDVADAVLKATKAIAPSLSNLSAHLDIPLRVQQTEILELRTGARHLIFEVAHNDAPFMPPRQTTLSDQFMLHVSYYRESLGSNTPAYQFLCFFKIIEAIRRRRGRMTADAKTRGEKVKIDEVREIVPREPEEFVPWLNAIFAIRPTWDDVDLQSIFVAEARGRKFNRIVDDHLRPLRNGIAHSVLDDKEIAVSADESVGSGKLIKWLPLTKCMVRRMLRNEFPQEFLAFLSEDGSFK